MKISSFLSLNLQDAFKGLIVAVTTSILGLLYPVINAGALPTGSELKVIAIGGLTAGVAYLLKNFFTPTPKTVEVDLTKTAVVDKDTKEKVL